MRLLVLTNLSEIPSQKELSKFFSGFQTQLKRRYFIGEISQLILSKNEIRITIKFQKEPKAGKSIAEISNYLQSLESKKEEWLKFSQVLSVTEIIAEIYAENVEINDLDKLLEFLGGLYYKVSD
jgi:hypothetical protein